MTHDNIPPDLAGYPSARPTRTANKPNWNYWLNLAAVDVLDAVCLSLDLDPRSARQEGNAKDIPGVAERLAIAISNMAARTLSSYVTESDRHYERGGTAVKLSEFRSWGESLPAPFSFPDEFPSMKKLETTVAHTSFAGRWPWGSHETHLLKQLAAAGDRFWKNYDPTDSTTAPTNDTVSKWLVDRGVADRVAQVMAQILRADGLKKGPRT